MLRGAKPVAAAIEQNVRRFKVEWVPVMAVSVRLLRAPVKYLALYGSTYAIREGSSKRPDFQILEPNRAAVMLNRYRPAQLSMQENIPDRRRLRPPFSRTRVGLVGE